MMTREEAIRIIEMAKAEMEWEEPLDYQIAFDLAMEALRQPYPQWIPVTERLPETKKAVLVWCPFYKNIFCAYRKEECDGWYIYGAYFTPIEYDVIAWMPLPEPYEEENNERV